MRQNLFISGFVALMMPLSISLRTIPVCAAVLLLSACSGGSVKQTLGLDHKAPDEFRVVSRPPLSVPPEFTLRPPAPGEEISAGPSAQKQAQSLVLGDSGADTKDLDQKARESTADTAVPAVSSNALPSASESRFISNVGANNADPDIRKKLHEDTLAREQSVEEEGWFDMLSRKDKPEPQVDAKKEAERIKDNKDEGKPVTEGETPTTADPKKQGLLQRLFK